MFGTQDTNALVGRTLEELDDDATSTTYDEVMYNFIDYIVNVTMACQEATIYDAIDHMFSDEFHDEFRMYINNYFARFHGSKEPPAKIVIIPREQLDAMIAEAGY